MTGEMLPGGEEAETRVRRMLRWGRNAAAIGAVSVGAGLFGATQHPTEVEVGPHTTKVALTLDEYVTIDADPIGSARIPTPENAPPLTGINVELGSIPSTEIERPVRTAPDPTTLQERLESMEVQRFATFYANSGSDLEKIPNAIRTRFLQYAVPFGLIAFAVPAAVGGEKRRAIAANFKQPRMVAATMLLLGSIGLQQYVVNNGGDRLWLPATIEGEVGNSPYLENLQISGLYGEVALDGINDVITYIDQTYAWYSRAIERFERAAADQEILTARSGYTTVGFFTDKHCNNATDSFIASTMDLTGAEILASGGDDFISGSEYEGLCVRDIGVGVNHHINKIAVGGNHGTRTDSVAQLEAAGFELVDADHTVTLHGLTFAGVPDPRISQFGLPTVFYEGESIESAGRTLRTVACGADADVLLVHDTQVAQPALASGCGYSSLSGHVHRPDYRELETPYGNRPQLVGDNLSGAREGAFTFAQPGQTITMLVAQYSQETGELVAYQRLGFTSSGSPVIEEIVHV